MVRLPDYRDGGAVGGVQSKRRGLSQGDFDSGAIGRGASKLGNAAANIGFEMKADESALDVLQADVERKQLMLEHTRTYENDPNHEKYGDTFDVASQAIREKAASRIRNPELRKKFLLQAEGSDAGVKDGIIRKGMELKDQAREVEVEGILEQNRARFIDPKASPEQRAQARADIDAHIQLSEQSGLLKPQAAARLRKKYNQQLAIDDVETRLLVEPDKVLEDFEFLGSGGVLDSEPVSIVPAPVRRTVGAPRSGPIKGLIIHATEGSDTMDGNGTWANQTNTGANYYIDKSGTVYEFAPDSVKMNHVGKGRNGQRPDLTNDSALAIEIMTRRGERPNPAQVAAAKALATQLASKHGFTTSDVYGHGELTRSTHRQPTEAIEAVNAIRGASDVAQADAGPVPVNKRGLTQYAGLAGGQDGDQLSDATENPDAARKAELIKRYGALDPKQRLTVIKHAQTAMGVGIEDAVKKDIARVKAGLEPEPDANGELAIDRAERLIGKTAKAQELRMRFEAARAERAAIAPLDTMSEEEADQHIASLKDTPWLQKAASTAWKKNLKLRDEDPASLVITDETVRITNELARKRASSVGLAMDAGGNLVMEEMAGSADPEAKQAAIGTILEARLQAQRDRGMDDYQTRIITQREAKSLLQISSPTGMDEKKYRAALEAAAQRAIEWYGPEYGKRALEEAISFQRGARTNEKKRFEDKVLRSIATGEEITASDMRKYNEVSRTTDMMSREFEMADPTAADDTRPYIGQPLTPTQQHMDWLKSNIADPAAIAAFDAKFGQGAAARALYAGTEAKTTKDLGIEKPAAAPAKSLMQSLFGN